MSQDFGKGKIYKITNDYNDDVYVGSTCDLLTKRFSSHKGNLNCKIRQKIPIYKLMNEIRLERFRIELSENYPCVDKYQLRQREGHFIRQFGTLNKLIAGRSKQENYEDNKEHYLEYKKDHYKVNKEHYQEIQKKYQEDNKEQIQKQRKSYYESNKDKILDEQKVKITCECGCIVNKHDLPRHKRSIKHQELMKISQTLI